jgi:hypothetical protein
VVAGAAAAVVAAPATVVVAAGTVVVVVATVVVKATHVPNVQLVPGQQRPLPTYWIDRLKQANKILVHIIMTFRHRRSLKGKCHEMDIFLKTLTYKSILSVYALMVFKAFHY